jgi:hypothetical protein
MTIFSQLDLVGLGQIPGSLIRRIFVYLSAAALLLRDIPT